jgi:hypothetical protein
MRHLFYALAVVVLLAPWTGAQSRPPTRHTFALGPSDFLLDGKPFQIVSGEMHPARIPPEYWRHRIRMASEAGLRPPSMPASLAQERCWLAPRVRGALDVLKGTSDLERT